MQKIISKQECQILHFSSDTVKYSYYALIHMQLSKKHEQMNCALKFSSLSESVKNNILNNRDSVEAELCLVSDFMKQIERGGKNA